jgi:hypothetical protein
MPYPLTHLQLSDMTRLGAILRRIGAGAGSMEEVAQRVVKLLYEDLLDPISGERQCALVRFYLTTKFGDLDDELRAFGARLVPGHELVAATRCLTLLATVGDKPEWNARRSSVGHQTIPLPSEQVVAAIPMVAQLVAQLGLDLGTVVRPDPELILELEQKTHNVFFVPEATDSPFIPAQSDFVKHHRIRAVLGFGGLLPTGDIYAVLMFTKVQVSRATADIFRNAAMNLKVALLAFRDKPIFAS